MALNKRERFLLIITILVVVVVINVFLVSWLVSKWKPLGGSLATRRRELESIRATIQREPEWQSAYKDLQRRMSKEQTQFEATSDVLKKIDEVGTESGIQIQSRRPMQPVERDVYRELPVQLRFESTIDTLVKFLYGLQTSSGFVTVEELKVTPRGDNQSILTCDITIRALAAKSEARSS